MKKYIIPLFIILITLTGCESSLYKVLYNSLDSFIYHGIAGYVDPTPEQERMIREKIDALMRWHRRKELPKYAATLQQLRGRMAAGLGEGDMLWLKRRIEGHGADLFNAVSDDVVTLLLSLGPEQVDRIERKIDERIGKMEEEARVSEEKRFRESERSVTRMMEFLYGSLSDKQKAEIGRAVRRVENLDAERIRMYREQGAAFMALLRGKPDRAALKEYIARMFINPERSYPDYYRERSERRTKTIVKGFLRFDRELVTADQRAHAVKKIDLLIQVLGELNKG
jgi:hypothetical protein